MTRLKPRATVILLITLMCFSTLLSTNIIKINLAKGYLNEPGFNHPEGIAMDSDDYHYVADTQNNKVTAYDYADTFYWSAEVSHPVGVAVHEANYEVLVTCPSSSEVMALDWDTGNLLWSFIGPLDDAFPNFAPSAIAVDQTSGDIYITDPVNNVVYKTQELDGEGGTYLGPPTTLSHSFNGPLGVALDTEGNVYIADTGNNKIQLFHLGGFWYEWGSLGSGDGQFNSPHGIAVDGSEIYVADTGNNRIQKFYTYFPTEESPYIGVFNWAFDGDVLLESTEFSSPEGVVLNSLKDLYVADTGNNRVQSFIQYKLALHSGGNPPGQSPNYVNPYEGVGTYPEGSVVTVTAVATGGYIFTCWSGDLAGSDNPTTINIAEDMNVFANFVDTANLLENPGFESAVEGVPTGWSGNMEGEASYFYSAVDSSVAPPRSGYYSCMGVEYYSENLGRFHQDVTSVTTPGKIYQISGWIKTGTMYTGSVVIGLDYVDATGATPEGGYVKEIGNVVQSDQDWAFFQSDWFTLPPMPSDAQALWFLFDFNDGAGTAYFDDVSLTVSGITVNNVVEGTPPSSPWNYIITELPANNTVADFTLPAEGGIMPFPSSGVTGGDYLVTEITKYYYNTTVNVNGTVYENSEAIVYLDAGDVIHVTFTNTATPSPGPGYTYGSLDTIPPDLTFPFPANTIVPVQSAWPIDKNTDGKLDLVVNKTMAILVNVSDPSIGTSTPLTVSATFDGAAYSDTTPTGSALSRLIAIYPIVPKNLGDKTITCTYQVGTSPAVALTPIVVTVRDTAVLKLFFAYFTPKQGGNYDVVNQIQFDAVVANITSFINAIYPMKQVIVNATYKALAGNATASSQGGAKNDMKYLANVAKLPASGLGTDALGVAIVPDNYFTYHGYPAGVVGAMVTPSVKAAVVSQNWYTAAAHEVAHALYSVFYPKEYYANPSLRGTTITGVWAEKGQWRSGWDIMDYMGPADGNWMGSSLTYKYLFKNATKSIADPEILFATGSIYKDGTIKLDVNSWFQETQGTPDTVVPGDFSLNFLDKNGNPVLDQNGNPITTSFDASFNMEYIIGVLPGQNVDPGLNGNLVSDSASFAFATILPEGTAAVQLVNVKDPSNPEVLATVNRGDIPVVGPPPPASVNTYFADSNFKPISSFDVLFKPTSSKVTTLTLTATNPATYYYTLDFKNNGPALSSVPITVKIPSDFVFAGTNPVQIGFAPVSYTFASGSLALTVPNVASGQSFTLRVHLDYALKGKTGYPANSPTTYSQSYSFDSTVNGAPINAPTINAVGKTVTAIGGFVTDTKNSPQGGLQVKVYKGTAAKWSTIVDGDGYYFVGVSAGGPYSIVLYDSFGVPVWVKTGVNVAANSYVPTDLKVLPINCAIQGFIKDVLGNPVSGVLVQLKGPLGKIQTTTTTTNTGGYYVFRFMLPGTYTVSITVPTGYTTTIVSKTVSVKLTETATVNFDLTKK
jgi:sugar lactone lactonase YvrE